MIGDDTKLCRGDGVHRSLSMNEHDGAVCSYENYFFIVSSQRTEETLGLETEENDGPLFLSNSFLNRLLLTPPFPLPHLPARGENPAVLPWVAFVN